MNEVELYEFDRQGYIIIEELLTPDEVASLSAAIDALEEDAKESTRNKIQEKLNPQKP